MGRLAAPMPAGFWKPPPGWPPRPPRPATKPRAPPRPPGWGWGCIILLAPGGGRRHFNFANVLDEKFAVRRQGGEQVGLAINEGELLFGEAHFAGSGVGLGHLKSGDGGVDVEIPAADEFLIGVFLGLAGVQEGEDVVVVVDKNGPDFAEFVGIADDGLELGVVEDFGDGRLFLAKLGEVLVVGDVLEFGPFGKSEKGRVAGEAGFQEVVVINEAGEVSALVKSLRAWGPRRRRFW